MTIILSDSAIDAISESLVHTYCEGVVTADVEIHKEPLVDLIGYEFEAADEVACEGEAPIFWGDGERGDMSVPLI